MPIIRYVFCDGTVSTIEVTKETFTAITQLQRAEWRQEAKRRYYCRSVECAEQNGFQHASLEPDPLERLIDEEEAIEREELLKRLEQALFSLLPEQRGLVKKVLFEEISQDEIARKKDVCKQAISNRMRRIYIKLKKIIEKTVD